MTKVDDSIASSIERFLAAVRLRKRVESAYLYGSYPSGRATEWSDIDLALISPDFTTGSIPYLSFMGASDGFPAYWLKSLS